MSDSCRGTAAASRKLAAIAIDLRATLADDAPCYTNASANERGK
jgi:hypothetical protein